MVLHGGMHIIPNSPNCVFHDGMALWNRQKEAARLKKLQEQREMRKMLDDYWPWGTGGAQPRGLRNLRLEGLFPNNDFLKAKRLVSPLVFGKAGGGGGGAPIVTHSGKKLAHTKEDPLLRFQWNKDLRKTVDNTLRYKTDQDEQHEYKKQLDAQVSERKIKEKREKHDDLVFHQRSFLKSSPWGKPGPGGTVWRPPGNIGINFLKSLGWSTERTLNALEKERQRYKDTIRKEYEDFKQLSVHPPNKISKNERIISPRKQNQENVLPQSKDSSSFNSITGKRKLSPLNRKKVNGEELVPLLAKQRTVPLKIPLGTTDVTRGNPEKHIVIFAPLTFKKVVKLNMCVKSNSNMCCKCSSKKPTTPTYLRELTNQMHYKKQRMKEMKLGDIEMVRRHFTTLDAFWGRPGHGAPRPVIKKGCLDRLLYDHTIYAR